MNNFELQNMNVTSLSMREMKETNGGFIGIILLGLVQIAVVGTLALGIVGNYERGYDQGKEAE